MTTDPDMRRYHRQMLLPDFGEAGQERLGESSVLLVGCGALGCAIADLLARAGVGRITIVDRDVVELTNLQRQTLFDERDVAEGLPKAEAAKRRLGAVNSAVVVDAVVADFNGGNAECILRDAGWAGGGAGELGGGMPAALSGHVLLDGTDNFETRYLLNDLAVKHGIPYCYGGVVGMRGMQMTVLPRLYEPRAQARGQEPSARAEGSYQPGSPCLRCLFETPPAPGSVPTCDTAGVLGPVVSIVAACQASDAIKLLLGRRNLVSPTLLELDLWDNQRRRVELANARRAECPCCGLRRFEFLESGGGGSASLCGQNAVQVCPSGADGEVRLDLSALAERLRPHGVFEVGKFFLRGELDGAGNERLGFTVFPDGRAIVRGTNRPELARSVYARYVGG